MHCISLLSARHDLPTWHTYIAAFHTKISTYQVFQSRSNFYSIWSTIGWLEPLVLIVGGVCMYVPGPNPTVSNLADDVRRCKISPPSYSHPSIPTTRSTSYPIRWYNTYTYMQAIPVEPHPSSLHCIEPSHRERLLTPWDEPHENNRSMREGTCINL